MIDYNCEQFSAPTMLSFEKDKEILDDSVLTRVKIIFDSRGISRDINHDERTRAKTSLLVA